METYYFVQLSQICWQGCILFRISKQLGRVFKRRRIREGKREKEKGKKGKKEIGKGKGKERDKGSQREGK